MIYHNTKSLTSVLVMCNRRAGKPCEEEGHVSPEVGEGSSGELRQHELEQQGAVGCGEEQDRHSSDTVKDPHHASLKSE